MEQGETKNNPESSPDTDSVAHVEDSALAPSCGDQIDNTGDANLESMSSGQDINLMDQKLRPIEQQFQYLLTKADEFQTNLLSRSDILQKEIFACVVPTFLRTCQPYFTYLESTARSTLPQRRPLPMYIRSRLLDFSQKLCARLEQLVLTYASFDFLSLEEAEPASVSHFYIGKCQIDRVGLSIYRYCRLAPYLAGVHTGLYKRMRWNVERPSESLQEETDGEKEGHPEEDRPVAGKERATETEYYFLCYEEVTEDPAEGGDGVGKGETVAIGNVVKMWSIGQWVQMQPEPIKDDIYEWVLCCVPQAGYHRLLCLGVEEPSACAATDCLVRMLFSQQSPVAGPSHETT
ncbi:UPF0575 protein C19orf67 homolog isoform X1 [Oncorhynchus nerka]|uniref:UPF0575 protein C19orf67 homolog isoform X1 n=1 Tax=Oncorhynchus nerka TaxID=8023 RepID=UPI0011318264|nr:UPF0575 protein C19orf67 homolog isoform X1 [Oncorhynchus nerka]XP_029537874.1 UPF0575 protein C19orf67 homolog isoform X1 [Oncorhynchus nerka]